MNNSNWFEDHKPAASAKTHLLMAALLWIVVGVTLLAFGMQWVFTAQIKHAWWIVCLAVVAGLLKTRFILRRSAQRIVERIESRGDARCLGGILSLRSWLFIVVMMVMGRFLRGGLVPRSVCGLIYSAVGTALMLAGLTIWNAWRHYRVDQTGRR